MKRIVLLTTVFVFSLLITKVFAQTPITTADVYKAYMDLEIVERALEKGNLDDDILKFLADKQNPIDEKMAVVNALFASSQAFSVEDSLAQKYVTYAHGKSLQEINKEDLLDYEWFVVGYLDAMQNYQNLSVSKAFMENALLLNQDSLVVNLIHTLYTTQYKLTNQNLQGKDIFNYWNESIKSIGTNIKNETTRFDIRPKALEYYFRYMIMPDNTIFNLELDSPFLMLESEKSSKIKVYGGVRPFNVEVLSGDADIVFDGVNLKIEGKTKGQTDYMLTDRNGLSVRGSIYVKGTNDELYEDIFVEFLLDSEFFLINGEEKEIDSLNPTKPFLNEDGRTLIPIRAFIESIGGIVGWDAENRKVIVTLNGNTLDLFLDQRLAYFNGEEFKMDTEATIVNNRAMVSLRVVSEKLGFDVEWMETERRDRKSVV